MLLRPMLLKLKLDTKPISLRSAKQLQAPNEGIVIDTQVGSDENHYVADGPEAAAEQNAAFQELSAAKEQEVWTGVNSA